MSITINGKEIEVTEGETVLRAARRAGIEIPHLCSLDWAPSPSASCRLGVVEVESAPRLQTSCTLEARDGMSVRTHTPRILKARRAILELLIASHPQDCLACVRARGCELAELAGDLGVRERRYVGAVKEHAMDISLPALWRDPNKCVLCGRCVTMCHDVQGVGAIDFTGRGFRTKVAPGFSIGLNVSACVYCGQCARVCSTGAIVERNHVDAVVAALADPDAVVVAQVAPAVPATLLEGHSRSQGVHTMLERMAGALKRVGFDAVFDTSFAADVTIMEEASELLDRIQNGGALPLFTSCSPAWVHWVETHRPDLIPHLSTCKSPQQMAGALIKEIYPHYASLGAAALAQIERRGFDVALLDHRLPNTDGLSLLYTMRERGCEAMVCMITAYASIDTAVAATRQGVGFFLPKPFTPDDLLGVVETLLRHRHARVEAERLRGEHEASLLALAEEKTQTHSLVSSLRDAVLVVNREGDVVLANRAMTALLGKPEAEVLMKPAQELLGEGALAPLCEQLAAPVKDRTVKQLDIDEQSYMASIVTFRAEDGAALGRILTLSDISEVRRLATEKSRFIRMMVHELRSPLGSVKGVLEVLDDKSLGEDLEPYLPMVARADARIDGLTGLIGDLLSLSRIEQTSKDDDVELVAIAPLVDEALDVQREAMAGRGIAGGFAPAADLPQVLIAPDELRLVVSNLVGNAVKYNRDGGSVTLTAAVARGAGDGDWLRLDVADTGLGIKDENLEQIFTEFFREKRPETRELEGNGLGLAIVKRLVERAGGRLEVSSAEGEGSTFSVLLPA